MTGLVKVISKVREAGDLAMKQIELPLRVAVCAWCQPAAPPAGGQLLSHGICPRHLRQLEQELRGILRPRRRARRKAQDPAPGELLFAF